MAAAVHEKVVVALDKFKGSVDAASATAAVARGLTQHRAGLDVWCCPVADGGEGTLTALQQAGFAVRRVTAPGPLGAAVSTGYVHRHGVAVVELADVSGLARLPEGPTPYTAAHASTAGTGHVVRAALDDGHHTVVLAVGGSAGTDGGAGLLTALGARLLDADGRELPPGGLALRDLARLDLAGLHPRLTRPGAVQLVVACDVDNPLLGEHGAAAVYGPQKGATPQLVTELDTALARLAAVLDPVGAVVGLPGAGAAGGVGFAAMLLGARMRGGIELVLELTGVRDLLRDARLVITGEGALDLQTLRGKAPAGVARAARAAGVPVVAVVGRTLLTHDEIVGAGFASAFALTDLEPDLDRCIRDAETLLERSGALVARELLARADVAG